MKIKIGIYAPTKEQYKATGTDGTPSPGNQIQNLNEKEGKLIPFSPTRRVGSHSLTVGAQVHEVDEPYLSLESSLIRSQAILQIEFDAIAEAKALKPAQISTLYQKYRTYKATADLIGVSESFVRQNIKKLIRRKK